MSVTIKSLSENEVKTMLDEALVVKRVSPEMLKKLEEQGWKVAYDYSIEKKYKGYFIVIEFCMGDFCVSICSKKGHWLLEKKQSVDSFLLALVKAAQLEARIDADEHWTGEDN